MSVLRSDWTIRIGKSSLPPSRIANCYGKKRHPWCICWVLVSFNVFILSELLKSTNVEFDFWTNRFYCISSSKQAFDGTYALGAVRIGFPCSFVQKTRALLSHPPSFPFLHYLFFLTSCSRTRQAVRFQSLLTPYIIYLKKRWRVGFKETRIGFANDFCLIPSQGFWFAVVSLWRSFQISSYGCIPKTDHRCRVSMLRRVTVSCFVSASLYSAC